MKLQKGYAAMLCVAALSGCVSVPKRQGPVAVTLSTEALAAATTRQESREMRLRAWPDSGFAGRVALSNGRKGGNGRIEWRQHGDGYEVTLSAPVTRQSWKLSGNAASATLEGLEGGVRTGTDAVELLRDATGLEIPVAALPAWASGTRADAKLFGAARLQYTADGTLAQIEQGGWVIDYLDWQDVRLGNDAQPIRVPRRIDAHRDQARVRLAVDEWRAEGTPLPGNPVVSTDDMSSLPSPKADALARELAALNLDDPAADMRARVAQGDLRPIGSCDLRCVAPGFDRGIAGTQGIRVLRGTTDAIENERHDQLLTQARDYARAYNQALSEWLKAQPHEQP